ncbi:MAG: CBS domain-containing protein [Natrialbaceae archaeon]|nr:CBS domain-containing protein [Natrialbaceae archaeon]
MPVTDIARETAVSVTADASLTDVVELMREEAVGSVVVVEDGSPIGLMSDRDLAVAVLGRDVDPDTIPVTELLPEDVITIEASAGVYDAIEVMSERGVRRLVVVDDGELAGSFRSVTSSSCSEWNSSRSQTPFELSHRPTNSSRPKCTIKAWIFWYSVHSDCHGPGEQSRHRLVEHR